MGAIAMVVIHAIWSKTLQYISISLALYTVDLLMRLILGYIMDAKLISVEYIKNCNIVKLVINKRGFKYKAGQWVYLTISTLGWTDAQPYTIASYSEDPESQNTVTIFVKNMAGPKEVVGGRWSERLAMWAQKIENKQASINDAIVRMEGPYGEVGHDYAEYDTIVLVAGGVGITAMYSLFKSIVEGHRCSEPCCSMKKVYLVWVKKSNSMWNMLPELLKYENIENKTYMEDKRHCEIQLYVTEDVYGSDFAAVNGSQVFQGRPNFKQLLSDIATERNNRVNDNSRYISVCACGPDAMVNQVQSACWWGNSKTTRFHFHK
ncbi:hypothetical protein AKO1_003343, partial [Acrasis kona]